MSDQRGVLRDTIMLDSLSGLLGPPPRSLPGLLGIIKVFDSKMMDLVLANLVERALDYFLLQVRILHTNW